MSENNEVWKDCKGYEGKYQVSNFGRVWSIIKQQYKSQRIDKDGDIIPEGFVRGMRYTSNKGGELPLCQ